MARPKQSRICTVCGTLQPIFDVKHMICGRCAGKKGGSTPKKARIQYFCEKCRRPIKKNQDVCKCGAQQDWKTLAPLVKRSILPSVK